MNPSTSAELDVTIVDTPAALTEVCERIARAPRVGIDTEFHTEKSYTPHLMVVQLLFDDGVALVDPLAIRDLRPMVDALAGARIVGHAQSIGESVWQVAAAPEQIPGLGAAAVKALRRFMDTMGELRALAGIVPDEALADEDHSLRDARPIPVGDLLEAVLSQTGYLEALEAERTIEAQGRLENLEQLVEVGREFDATAPEDEDTLNSFLQQIALVADADSRSDEEGLVTLMTLHNAKGLEYPIVFIAGCEDGVFPHSRALDEGGLEEERRLFYVGVTRAMRELYLTYALRRAVFGAQTYGLRSRFLNELPGELLDEYGQPERLRVGNGPAGFVAGVVGSAAATAVRDPEAAAWSSSRTRPAPSINTFRLGEDVVHAAFGEGVVIGVEPDGVIVVRFARDGSERKLMAEYAPVSRR